MDKCNKNQIKKNYFTHKYENVKLVYRSEIEVVNSWSDSVSWDNVDDHLRFLPASGIDEVALD